VEEGNTTMSLNTYYSALEVRLLHAWSVLCHRYYFFQRPRKGRERQREKKRDWRTLL